MMSDNLRYNLKKILKKLKILKNNSPDWKKVISLNKKIYEELKIKAKEGQKILICTSAGGHLVHSHFDALLALALTRYGADVEIMLCDKALKSCMMTTSKFLPEEIFIKKGQKNICKSCFDSGKEAFEDLGLRVNYYSDFYTKDDQIEINKQIKDMTYDQMRNFYEENISVGEQAHAGALRYYAVGTLEKEIHAKEVLKKFLYSALLTKKIFFNFFSNKKFEKIILNHAIYVPQGIICEVSKFFGIKIIAYTSVYRKNSFIYSYGDTYHKTMMEEDINDWIDINLDEKKEKILFDYLNSRKYGNQDMFYYFKKPSFKIEDQLNKIGVDLKKPIIGILTNIIWDAQIIYKNNIFDNMVDWLISSIKHLSKRQDIEVVVRCHPGEVNSDRVSKQKVKETIYENFKKIPENLKIIDSDNNISTYTFADYCNTLVIYATKMGMEFSPYGNRVICAGESYIKNKNITIDPKSKEEYFELLDEFPNIPKPSNESILRAKKYAYHYYFRRAIQVQSLDSFPKNWPPFKINKMAFKKIINNEDSGLKTICDSIINDKKFIFS